MKHSDYYIKPNEYYICAKWKKCKYFTAHCAGIHQKVRWCKYFYNGKWSIKLNYITKLQYLILSKNIDKFKLDKEQ